MNSMASVRSVYDGITVIYVCKWIKFSQFKHMCDGCERNVKSEEAPDLPCNIDSAGKKRMGRRKSGKLLANVGFVANQIYW